MRLGVIVNPVAGSGKALRRLPSISEGLRQSGHHLQITITQRPGDAIADAVRLARSGCEALIAVGGDGTLNEILNGSIAAKCDPLLGFVPAGRGSDTARTIPALNQLPASGDSDGRDVRRVDVGWVQDRHGERRYFLNVAGFGFDAAVSRRADALRWVGSTLPYILATGLELLPLNSHQVSVHAGDLSFDRSVLMVLFANGQYFGGGMRIAPHASIDDGVLDMVAIDSVSRSQLLVSFARVYSGTHLHHRAVSATHVKNAQLNESHTLAAHVDGKYIGCNFVEVGLCARAIRWLTL